jgi:uncharacterized repeat protein (TIGR03943 family)
MSILTRILSGVRNALILMLWGTGILWLAGSARLSTYLHPSLQPFTVAAGLLLILLAGFAIMGLASGERMGEGESAQSCDSCVCDHEHHAGQDGLHHHHHEGESHSHHHDHHGFLALILKTLVLLIPIAVLLSGNADRFTTTTVTNRGVVQDLSRLPSANASAAKAASSSTATATSSDQSGSSDQQSQKAGGPMPLQVIDMLYALQMPSYREEFEGKEVEMIAQYVPMTTGNPKGDRFQAVRMFITCCAADAKPVGVTVKSSAIPKVPEMGWIKVTGKPTFPMEGGKRTAILEASKIEPCDAPSEPFVY